MSTKEHDQYESHSADESHPSCFSLAPWVVHHKLKHDPSAFLLYHFYLQYCNLNKGVPCYRSTETMSKLTGLSRSTYKRSRDELEKQGLIRVERPESKSRDTVIVWLVNIWSEAHKWKKIQDDTLNEQPNNNHGNTEQPTRAKISNVNKGLGQNLAQLGQNLACDRAKIQPLNRDHEIKTNKERVVEGEMEVEGTRAGLQPDRPPHDTSYLSDECDSPTEKNGELFREKTEKSKSDATVAAKLLFNALSTRRKIFRKVSINKWADTLRDFMAEWEVPYNELASVLDWYCDHIGEEFVPEAYSASGFVEKYPKIRNQMNIQNRKRVKPKGGLFTDNQRQEFVQRYLERKNGKH